MKRARKAPADGTGLPKERTNIHHAGSKYGTNRTPSSVITGLEQP